MKKLTYNTNTSKNLFSKLQNLSLLPKLIKDALNNKYKISTKTIFIAIAAIIYIISPLDLIPDFIPLLGITDDFLSLTFLINTLSNEVDNYKIWKSTLVED